MTSDQNKLILKSSEIEILRKRGYTFAELLGEGSFAKVYRTEFVSNTNKQNFKLACKIIDVTVATTHYVNKFLPQELEIVSKLSHPHIIEIHSIFQLKNKYYIFMRYAENGDLLDYIIRYGPINEKLARFWLRQISLAIQYLHILEIAHRDIKCDNILITIHNNVKLTDFGFSRSLINNNEKILLSETYCGSMSYASPQILIGEPYNPKATDMWSLGCVLYVMLNKSSPFDTENLKTMIEHQLKKQYKFRTKYISQNGKEVIKLVSCLLEPKENLRFKIEEVLSSSWISMEQNLRTLNRSEFFALANALDKSKRSVVTPKDKSSNATNIMPNNRRYSIINYLKEYDDGFDLNIINSEVYTERRLST